MNAIRIAIVTVSDGVARGERQDASGNAIAEWAKSKGHEIATQLIVADDQVAIVNALISSADRDAVDVILTTGGTGLTARDVTPEATAVVIEREAPGVAEAIRAYGAAQTKYSWLSRGVAGTRGKTLIVNLPGSESGVRDGLEVLNDIVAHAVQLLRGIETSKH